MKCVKLRTCGSYLIPSFLLLTAHYSFEVTTTIGIAVGGGLALLFCGMSLVFVTIRRTKRGKDHSKASKVENYKSTPKGGIIFYKMHIWKSMCYFIVSFLLISQNKLFWSWSGFKYRSCCGESEWTQNGRKRVWCYRKSLLWRCRCQCVEPYKKVVKQCGFE